MPCPDSYREIDQVRSACVSGCVLALESRIWLAVDAESCS